MTTDRRIAVFTAFFVITILLLATLDQCQTTRSGPGASTPSAPAATDTPQSTTTLIRTTAAQHEEEAAPALIPSPTPVKTPPPVLTARPSPSPTRLPATLSKGMLDCVPVGAFSRCVDEVLNIEFEYPSSWGEIEAVLRTGGYAGYAYDYDFGGKTHAETEPLVAGGRSVDFSEGRGAMPTDFGGYEHPGWQGARACDSRWSNSYPLCREVSDNVAWMIRFPNASVLCEDVLGNWQTMPVFRIEISLPDNPTINGFVFEAPFFSEQFAGRVQNDLYPLLGARLDRRASKCDGSSRRAFDAQLMTLIESITDRSADTETLDNVDELVHLAESIAVQEIAVAPPFLFVSQNELLEFSTEHRPTLIADLSEFGAILDAIRFDDVALVLHEQGLQQVLLRDGSSDLVVHFDPPARFGQLVPLDDGSVLYQAAVDEPQATAGVRHIIGLYQPPSGAGRIILSVEQSVTLLGPTADGTGLYLLPRGQAPDFTHALEVSLASGETIATLDVTGDPFAVLSPDRRSIISALRYSALELYDLTSVPIDKGAAAFPHTPSHVRELFWTADGYAYFCLLAGDFYDYYPDHPPASYGIWRLDPRTGKLRQITPGSRQERQLLAVSPDGKALVTGDLQGAVLIWDVEAGKVMAEIRAPQEELVADGPSPDGQWLLLRDRAQSVSILVDLLTGTGRPITLPTGAIFVGWRK